MRPLSDPTYQHRIEAFPGIGLRPYSPAHLRAARMQGGSLEVSWIRRTRIDGDSWENVDVPLGEDSERYLVRVMVGEAVRRETEVTAPAWSYSAAQQDADGVSGAFRVAVAQVSQRFGAGPFKEVDVDG